MVRCSGLCLLTAAAATSDYRADIDGLRAVAVLAVVFHHLSPSLVPGGYVGVDVFFVISGYLITKIIVREMLDEEFTFSAFYLRRARRIFPALFVVLAVTLLVGYFVLLPSDYANTLQAALGTAFFSSNVVFWRSLMEGYFAATDAALNPLLHTWSLSVEEQFYLLFPVLLLVCVRWCRHRVLLVVTTCAAGSLVSAAMLADTKSVAVFFLAPFRGWELLVGAMLALGALPPARSRASRETIGAGGLVALVAACATYDANTKFPGLAAVLPVFGAAAIIHSGATGPTFVRSFLDWKPMVFVGLISYSLYLWHWPLIVFARYKLAMEPITPYVPLLFSASVVLAALSYQFVERPFRRVGRDSNLGFFACSFAVLSISVLAAVAGLLRDGFAHRFSAEVISFDRQRSPDIPFKNCNARQSGEWCVLGASGAPPTLLLWGDSHLLSWAPALNDVLTANGVSAIFVTNFTCPPILGVRSVKRTHCEVQNRAVRDHLVANTRIEKVVLAAHWTHYFRSERELVATSGDPPATNARAVADGLRSTLQWLKESEHEVVVIGPVPWFAKSVPLGLAQEQATGTKFDRSSLAEQAEHHGGFLKAMSQYSSAKGFRFLDPIRWLCEAECAVVRDGVALYRDSNHLSVAGAASLREQLREGVFPTKIDDASATRVRL